MFWGVSVALPEVFARRRHHGEFLRVLLMSMIIYSVSISWHNYVCSVFSHATHSEGGFFNFVERWLIVLVQLEQWVVGFGFDPGMCILVQGIMQPGVWSGIRPAFTMSTWYVNDHVCSFCNCKFQKIFVFGCWIVGLRCVITITKVQNNLGGGGQTF